MKCTHCKERVKTVAFATYRTLDGIVRRRGICRECRGEYALKNFARLRRWRQEYNIRNRTKKSIRDKERRLLLKKIVDDIKAKTPCADCGQHFPPVAMDFDHIFAKNKGVAILVAGAYRIDLIMEEIKLCDIVCACCHRIRTATRKQNHAPHKNERN